MLKNREGQGVPQTIFRTRHNHEWVDVTSDDVFSRGMGMLVPRNDLGFGERSWRYSMLVKDGASRRCSSSRMWRVIPLKSPMRTPY
jgi:peroxiredoxin